MAATAVIAMMAVVVTHVVMAVTVTVVIPVPTAVVVVMTVAMRGVVIIIAVVAMIAVTIAGVIMAPRASPKWAGEDPTEPVVLAGRRAVLDSALLRAGPPRVTVASSGRPCGQK